jgi:hypothetical protein
LGGGDIREAVTVTSLLGDRWGARAVQALANIGHTSPVKNSLNKSLKTALYWLSTAV